jgi:hypothetical protein
MPNKARPAGNSGTTTMNRIVRALAPFSGAAAAVIFSAAVFAAAPARAQGTDQLKADFASAEAGLFQNDDRFALKTLAKPQRGA